MTDHSLRPLPRLASLVARPLPLAPISIALSALSRAIVAHHPGLLRRLGNHAGHRFALDLTDLPFVLLLEPGPATPRVTAHRRHRVPPYDSRITGVTSAFLGMLHGDLDGDALFFSNDLMIEGDTAAVLALRNAIDDAELDLGAEIARLSGPLAPLLTRALPHAERLSGLVLHRVDTPVGDLG